MRLPRKMDAALLVKTLGRLGYSVTRRSGRHIRLTTNIPRLRQVTVPNHSPIKLDALNAILTEVATHHRLTRDEVLRYVFDTEELRVTSPLVMREG
jgi:predicted RNA binding protein YcfA (HicA-like mRNA interferase family)